MNKDIDRRGAPAPGQRPRQMHISVRGCTDLGRRSSQQDNYNYSEGRLYAERGMLAVLSDGMGGMKDGDRFSAIAVEEMVRCFAEGEPLEDDRAELIRAYQSARKKALASCEGEEPEGGATVVAVLVRRNRCTMLSVGDSRIYLLRRGGLVLLNREQTLGVVLDEAAALGYIPIEEARENRRRASLINHLCETGDKASDVSSEPFALCSGDKLVLMSDGVFGTLSEDEICMCLRKPGAQGADDIIDAVLAKDKNRQDNSSVLVLAFEPANNSKTGRDHNNANSNP